MCNNKIEGVCQKLLFVRRVGSKNYWTDAMKFGGRMWHGRKSGTGLRSPQN